MDIKEELEKNSLKFFKNGMRAILYRNGEPELGLDVTKGFKIGFFLDNDPLAEIAELNFEIFNEDED